VEQVDQRRNIKAHAETSETGHSAGMDRSTSAYPTRCGSDSRVTDARLADLKRVRRLTTLDLRGTEVSDRGLAHSKGMTSLSTLRLALTHVTDDGVQALKSALPKLTIER
jgi:hypothetical protein